MRKSMVLGALLAGVIGVQGLAAQAAPPPVSLPSGNGFKIAYIHSQRLIQEAPGASDARTTLERERNKYVAELQLLEDSIKNMITDYEQKQVMMSPDAKKKRQDEINAKRNSFDARSQQYEQQIAKRQKDLIEPIMDRINKALNDLRKERGYNMIFDAAGGSIIAADSTLDLTTEVLNRLKAAAGSAVPRTPGN